jgi:nanoRNase/pAp phosphatase (c-di-AMP/oligoRNAs hydrolase)
LLDIPKDTPPDKFLANFPPVIIIDHHTDSNYSHSNIILKFLLSSVASNSEIITNFFKAKNLYPSLSTSKLLSLGILADTGNFKYGTNDSINIFTELLRNGIEIKKLFQVLQTTITKSEKIARIKAAKRISEIYQIHQYFILISNVSAYEASACNGLIDLGADLSFIIVKDKNHQFRISSRATDNFLKETSINLGSFMEKIGIHFNGSGGGHEGAAGCYGSTLSEEVINEIEHFIISQLRIDLK